MGIRAWVAGPVAQRAQDRRASPPPGRCSASRGSRSSHPPRPRRCPSPCPPRPRARACGGARAGPRRPAARGGPRRPPPRPRAGPRASRLADLGHLAVAHQQVGRPSSPARGSRRCAPPHEQRGRVRRAEPVELERRHAGCGARVGSGAPRARRAVAAGAGQQLVEHGHPHHHARLDLLGDQRLGRVDHLGRQLHAPVDRARVHQQLVRAPGGGRRSGSGAAYSRSDGTKCPGMRSCCMRSA